LPQTSGPVLVKQAPRSWLVAIFFGLIVLSAVTCCIGPVIWLRSLPDDRHKGRCPACGCEFTVRFRNDPERVMLDDRCPTCGLKWPAGYLHDEWRKAQGLEPPPVPQPRF
jgi:hypothetical protein